MKKKANLSVVESLTVEQINSMNTIVPLNLDAIKKEICPPDKYLLSPWLPEAGLALLYAATGVGKTYFCLNVAFSVASGGQFLGFKAPEKKKVLYIDGEMKFNNMQSRIKQISKHYPEFPAENFNLITPDKMPNFRVPKICSQQGQSVINRIVNDNGIDLVILDNISTLTTTDENPAEEWNVIQDWQIENRSAGISMLFIHHTGNDLTRQRGTTKRKDIMDTVILLERGMTNEYNQGINFKINFDKHRGFYGADALPFEAIMHPNGEWSMICIEQSTMTRTVEMIKIGMTQSEIANELGVNRSSIHKAYKRAKSLGLLPG